MARWWCVAVSYFAAVSVLAVAGVASGVPPNNPRFSGTISNVTVTEGSDVSFSCTVENLGDFAIVWIHLKRNRILSLNTIPITRSHRHSTTHDSHKTWTLHIAGVTEEDSGDYSCQVNTVPVISQVGLLQVLVPPTIVDTLSSNSEMQVREEANVTLQCAAHGVPEPGIMWKREDGAVIVTNTGNPEPVHNGSTLALRQVSRTQKGAYLCIASNGVPPSASKRITLHVEFPPQVRVSSQPVGVDTGDNVTLECFVEAFPKAITYWVEKGMMITSSPKYRLHTSETLNSTRIRLTIFNFTRDDSTAYRCVAKNSLGEAERDIKLTTDNREGRNVVPQVLRIHEEIRDLLSETVEHQRTSASQQEELWQAAWKAVDAQNDIAASIREVAEALRRNTFNYH